MATTTDPGSRLRDGGWLPRLVARSGFQKWAARLPLGSMLARRDGAEIFDILQGFVASGVLGALVELDLLRRLLDGAESGDALAMEHGIPVQRMEALLQAGAALNLLRRRRDGRFGLARKGAAILGVPGLEDMIRHNRAFQTDMQDPVSLMRGGTQTNMAQFWPYVFQQGQDVSNADAARYSDLMARSQVLVAEDSLRAVNLRGTRHLMDVGGGAGVFMTAVLRRHRKMQGTVFDLPGVRAIGEAALARAGVQDRATFVAGSFREGIPCNEADAISLVRVLYDHDDDTVRDLLARVHEALPHGGRLIISEPMSGAASPDRATDVYFAFYTMAMGTGRVRSAARITELCAEAGFEGFRIPTARRPFITSVVTAVRA